MWCSITQIQVIVQSSAEYPIIILKMLNLIISEIYYVGGGTKEMAKREVPEFIKDYPEPKRWIQFFYTACKEFKNAWCWNKVIGGFKLLAQRFYQI